MAPPPTTPKLKVFIVDDHTLVREWLTNLINQQPGLVVCGEAADVSEALQKATFARPDVAVVDISLNGASGIELIKELKQRSSEVPVLVLSMHEERLHVERALQAGARGYVMKREASIKVIEAIRRILKGGIYVSPDTAELLAVPLVGSRAPANQEPVEQFSDRERAVFEMLAEGRNVNQIAGEIQVDVKTVYTYCTRMREKLRLGSTAELLREAFRWHDSHHSP